jgi:hypothetical protein
MRHGTRVVKLFLHTTPDEQDDRLVDRLEQPWKRWKVNAEDFRNRAKRGAYVEAYEDDVRADGHEDRAVAYHRREPQEAGADRWAGDPGRAPCRRAWT